MINHLIYYHNDLDGHCCAAIVKLWLLQQNIGREEICMREVDYNNVGEMPELDEHSVVYVLDFQLPDDMMIELNDKYVMYWIDHHKRNNENLPCEDFKADVQILSDTEPSAAALTWDYFGPHIRLRDQDDRPAAVQWINYYDSGQVFRHWDRGLISEGTWNRCMNFQLGMMINGTSPEESTEFWQDLLLYSPMYADAQVDDLIDQGEIVQQYRSIERQSLRSRAVSCKWLLPDLFKNSQYGELKTLALNAPDIRGDFWSEACSEDDWNEHDVFVSYYHEADEPLWRVTITAARNDIDVSEIAALYDGGGHARRAGFMCNYPPFLCLPESPVFQNNDWESEKDYFEDLSRQKEKLEQHNRTGKE